MVTMKENHDGPKLQFKGRLVAYGFQELLNPQSDSLTAAKESFKLPLEKTAINESRLVSLDIRAAFLQSKTLV